MKKAYIIKLTDYDGDSYNKLVDQETWNWVNLTESGRPNENTTSWEDGFCPQNIKERIIKAKYYDGVDIHIFSGSWGNDRAILAPTLEDNESFNFDTTKSLLEAISKAESLGYEVDMKDEYEGLIY